MRCLPVRPGRKKKIGYMQFVPKKWVIIHPIHTMDDVSSFLGLPDFDFRNVTSAGWYNVGGHRGYDTVTVVDEESDKDNEPTFTSPASTSTTSLSSPIDLTSISDELMTDLLEFYRPYNERLFELIGKRCAWKE